MSVYWELVSLTSSEIREYLLFLTGSGLTASHIVVQQSMRAQLLTMRGYVNRGTIIMDLLKLIV